MFVSKLIKKGVQVGSEYREHRKEVKLTREGSEQNVEQQQQQRSDPNIDTFLAGQSASYQPARQPSAPGPADAPPAYSEFPGGSANRRLASGPPASDDKKQALAQYDDENEDDSSDDDLSTDDDEADWELDEALDRAHSSASDDSPPDYRPVDALMQDVLTANNTSTIAGLPPNFECTPLPCPVIIPQRRPRRKERGFIHAYAPLLGECSGINQEAFITFLKNFHKSSQASPVWSVIMVSAAIAGLAPSVIAMAVTNAVQVAAGAAKEVQTRHRANDFLDRMNEEVFKPRGLFAMIVKYKTSAEVAKSESSLLRRFGVGAQQVDFSTGQAVAKYNRNLSDEHTSMSERMKNIRLASGTTKGAIELPEAAPLVFPELDKVIVTEGPETFKDKAKDAKAFLADYMDRRAQMEYAKQDAGSGLVVPQDKRTMKAEKADPNHPMYNSGLVGLVSGGKLSSARGGRSSSGVGHGYDPSAAYGRPSLYDSSRLYSSSSAAGFSPREMRRHDKRERRALRTEQRMAQGRRISRKKERRYDNFLYEQESMHGGDPSFGVGRGRGRRGVRGGGPIGLLVGAAGAAMNSGRQLQSSAVESSGSQTQYNTSSAADLHERTVNARGEYGVGEPSPQYGSAGMQRRQRGQKKGGAVGMVKRIMQEDVLYLMIVNMPSEAELAEAREAIAAAQAGK